MTITTLKKGGGRVIRLILLTCLIAILQNSSTTTIIPQAPNVTATWQVGSPDNNHLGSPIKATLYVTTLPGVTVDLEKLPDIGDILPLPPKVVNTTTSNVDHYHYDAPPEILEGELEVVSRRIAQYSKDGLVVTEIDYELQYLLPIDLSAPSDDKRLPWNVPIYQKYLRFYESTGKIDWLSTRIHVKMADFYIVPRVDEDSQPVFVLFKLTPPATHWPKVRLAGFGLITLAFVFPAWRIGSLIKAHRRQRADQIANAPPTASKLYLSWCENPDPAIFIKVVKLYRRGIWGRPQATTWWMTTFILYSGVRLSQLEMQTVFARLVKEVNNELPT